MTITDSPLQALSGQSLSRLSSQQETLLLWTQDSSGRHQRGTPVEFLLSPGAFSDTSALDQFDFDLPPQAWIIGDKAYNVYHIEDVMADCDRLLLPIRKANSKRPREPWMTYLLAHYRKQVETAGSQIERLLPKHIHAVTPMVLNSRPSSSSWLFHLLYLPPLGGNLGYFYCFRQRVMRQPKPYRL
ncbi:MAG: hypothetical protein IPM07_08195 [Anaerolineales bacterium]|nr:hypothetical protein [Anaerolineales bacterium]